MIASRSLYFILALSLPLFAQTNLSVTTFLVRDDNAFKNREAHEEWINNTALYIGHRISGKSFQLQGTYSAELLTFTENTGLNNHAHKVSLSSAFYKDAHSFQLSGFAKFYKYRDDYAYYELNRYHLDASFHYDADLKHFFSLGLLLNQDDYREFEDLDNLTYRLYFRFQRFFQIRLSLTAEAGFGIKDYTKQVEFKYYGQSGGQMNLPRYREDPVKAALLNASLNIGKSLTSRLGLALTGGGQWFVGEPIQTYSEGIYYYTENDLFDDPYAYQGYFASLKLTQQFAVGFQARVGARVQVKDYAGTPALDEQGELTGSTRRDVRDEYFLMITKRFNTALRFPTSIDIFLNFMYRHNPSNDPYYNYEEHIGLIGLSINV